MAARLKESSEGEVTVVCVGEDSAKNSLKNCLAVGADHAFLVSDDAFKGSDTTGIANILKKCDRKIRSGQWSEILILYSVEKKQQYADTWQGGLSVS